MTIILYVLVYILVLLLQLSFANLMAVYGIQPNFLVIYLVFLSLKVRRVWGGVIGFGMGIVQDAVASPIFGVNAFSKTFAGFFVHLLPKERFGTPIFNTLNLLFWTGLVHDFLFNLIYSFGGGKSWGFILLRYAVPGAVYTAVLGMMIQAIFPKFLQAKHG